MKCLPIKLLVLLELDHLDILVLQLQLCVLCRVTDNACARTYVRLLGLSNGFEFISRSNFLPVYDEVSYICWIAFQAQCRHRAVTRSSRHLRIQGGLEERHQRARDGEERKTGRQRVREDRAGVKKIPDIIVASWPLSFSLHLDHQFPC